MQKTVIINKGIPTSGKSTFAKEITKTLNENGLSSIICSTDDLFMIDDKYKFDITKLRENHLKNQEKFLEALSNDIDLIIVDNTNLEPWEAKPYYMFAKKFDYKVILIDFEPRDLSEIISFQTNPNYNKNIPQSVLQDMLKRYETYKSLLQKEFSSPITAPKRIYDEKLQKIIKTNEPSEQFHYDELIFIKTDDFLKVKKIIGNLILKKLKGYDLNEITLIPRHFKIIMQEFHKRTDKTLTSYDLKDILEKSTKQIDRYLDELAIEFSNIIVVKKGKKKAYKLIDSFEVFIKAFKSFDDLEELIYLAQESNPELFKRLNYQMKKENDIYIFKHPIFESIKNRDVFDKLKTAIKENEYRDIKFNYENKSITVKPIKFIFTDNNWYLAYVQEEDVLKLGRIAFVEEVKYSKNI